MSNSRKKVIVRRFSGDTLPGYLPPASIAHNNAIDLLDLTGRILSLPLNDIKTVCYVRDFNLADTQNPERLTRRTFLARPRSEGLWLRLTFRTGDLLEGLAPTDRTLLDALIDDAGLFLTPPDTPSSTHPRTPAPRRHPHPLPPRCCSRSPHQGKPPGRALPPSPRPRLPPELKQLQVASCRL